MLGIVSVIGRDVTSITAAVWPSVNRRHLLTSKKRALKMSQDKELKCVDCGGSFLWTAAEQEFFREKGFTNEPKRCKPCRQAKKEQQGNRR
jgi:hypothetical protein